MVQEGGFRSNNKGARPPVHDMLAQGRVIDSFLSLLLRHSNAGD